MLNWRRRRVLARPNRARLLSTRTCLQWPPSPWVRPQDNTPYMQTTYALERLLAGALQYFLRPCWLWASSQSLSFIIAASLAATLSLTRADAYIAIALLSSAHQPFGPLHQAFAASPFRKAQTCSSNHLLIQVYQCRCRCSHLMCGVDRWRDGIATSNATCPAPGPFDSKRRAFNG